ncbi:MAG: FecR domain-containing protein [Candidatus Omnitrophota bacterium]|nr:FecR domain-containing protein [Candidatus Omnitrophota bacterium]
MRKFTYALIIGVIAALSLTCVSFAAEGVKSVSVVEMKGTVEIMKEGATEWTPATIWMKLGTGDTVRTEKDSYADLNFNGIGQAALVRVGESSSMKVASYVASGNAADRKIALDLSMGDVLVKANKMKTESQFQVKTPTSIVGVRGTGFKVSVSSEE